MSFKSPYRMFPWLRNAREAAMGSPQTYAQRVLSLGPIAYWPLWEADPQVNCNLFNVNMETGDLSQFDALVDPDADLSATAAAAMGSTTIGMSVIIDDNVPVYGAKNFAPPVTNKLRLRCYIDPNSIIWDAYYNIVVLLTVQLSAPPWDVIQVILWYEDDDTTQLRCVLREDGGATTTVGTVAISDAPHYFEFYFERSSSTGSNDAICTFWVDGVQIGQLTGRDCYALWEDIAQIQVGALTLHAGIVGTIYLDELCANDTGVEIGAVPAMPVAQCLVNPLQNGAYTGVQLANALGPDGVNYAPFFDGINDFVAIHSATLAAAFNGAEGSVIIWGKINAGAWTDGAQRMLFRLGVAGNNYVTIAKQAANNEITFHYRAGGVSSQRTPPGITTTDWFCAVITWSATADEMWPYLNGVPAAAVRNGLGVWAGVLQAGNTVIGALNTGPGSVWHGWEAHCAVLDRPLTAAEVLSVSTI